jgi:eukaryotic-like serine/threonine-protein kinase
VDQACAHDARLKQEVESLLASESAAADFCETPAAALLGGGALSGSELATPRLQSGARLGAYEISAFIAAGGMGEVYRARHTLLSRDVAIKVILGQPSDDSARRRLMREAKHASVLTHANICTIHEVGEGEIGPFIVMQYVGGRSLKALIRDALPSLDDALGYGMQIADALAHAHGHGIIHRDLKSSNVVVSSDGRPIVLDFGLAKRLSTHETPESHEPTVTGPETPVGTLSHMAPEVLLGGPADVRTDVWSLGVLLYELATGELPFTGRTPYETSSAILGEAPRAMSARVPLALRLVIERCLAKDPARRYQRAAEVGTALDAIRRRKAWPIVGRLLISARRRTLYAFAGAIPLVLGLGIVTKATLRRVGPFDTGRVSTLAVLPLENATGSHESDYYADGITDALIEQLGAASDVRIISRASAIHVASQAKTLPAAARQLGADAVVRGVVRKTGDRVLVDLRLVHAASGRILWSDRFERDARDVLALEADAVRSLAIAVRLTLRADARDRLATVRAVTPAAYEEYLKGRYEWNSRTQKSLQLAIDHFARAVDLDPTYAPAHAALADCYNQLGTVIVGAGSPQQFRPRAAAEAVKALQLDPYSAEAHAALGYVHHYNWEWADAEKEFRRAIELNPSYSLARIWYANLLMSRNRMSEAVQQVMAARDLDPFSLIINTNVAWVLDDAGRPADAVRHLERTLALDSEYVQARWRLTGALMRAGRLSESLEQAKRLVRMTGRSAPSVGLLGIVYSKVGDTTRAREILQELLERARREYVPTWPIASLFFALGERDSGMTWLEKAYAERSNAIAYLLSEPGYIPIRDDPRYKSLLARTGLR